MPLSHRRPVTSPDDHVLRPYRISGGVHGHPDNVDPGYASGRDEVEALLSAIAAVQGIVYYWQRAHGPRKWDRNGDSQKPGFPTFAYEMNT